LDNPEKLATKVTQDEKKHRLHKKKKTHNAVYVGHHYAKTNTNNENKT
jgi:quinolinate synthase